MTKTTLKPLPKSLDQTDIAGLEQLHSEMLATCHDLDLTPTDKCLQTISDMDLEAARGVVRVLHAEIREHLEKKVVASDDKKEDTSSKKTESVQQRMARQKAAREERDASQPKKENTVAKTAKKASAKKATVTTSKKKVVKKAANGAGHTKFADEQTITWIRKEEGLGAREGSGREERRKILKRSSGKTVAKYLELGGSISTLGRAVEEKLVSVK